MGTREFQDQHTNVVNFFTSFTLPEINMICRERVWTKGCGVEERNFMVNLAAFQKNNIARNGWGGECFSDKKKFFFSYFFTFMFSSLIIRIAVV